MINKLYKHSEQPVSETTQEKWHNIFQSKKRSRARNSKFWSTSPIDQNGPLPKYSSQTKPKTTFS